MAERRMFAKSVIGSARFLKMPATSRLLYYDLGMEADDDGFVEAFGVIRKTGATEDDLRVLASRGFVKVVNEDLVSYITDWKQNNYIRPDRYKESVFHNCLVQLENGVQVDNQMTTIGIPVVDQMETQDSVGKGSVNGDMCRFAIQLLNELTGSSYRTTTKKTQSLIAARVREGFTQSDFETVIRYKCKQWLNDEKMREYLRPETLFGPKFEGYLNDARRSAPKEQAIILAPLEDPFEAAARSGGLYD